LQEKEAATRTADARKAGRQAFRMELGLKVKKE
jgi:hypothetical protein